MTSETPESETPESDIPETEASEAETPEAENPEAEPAEVEGVESEADESENLEGGAGDFDGMRLVEALLFASSEALAPAQLARFLPEDANVDRLLGDLEALYANRGVNLVKRGGRWAFRTAEDLAPRMELENKVVRKLSRVGLETLAVIAYHQPITRAEIEEVRGVALSKGTLDTLLEIGWIRPKGRRKTPGRPVTWGTSESFLDHFGLETLDALPGVDELKAAGLLDTRPALTALGDRGLLPAVGEIGQERVDDEEEDEADSEVIEGSDRELLEETFGEDLLPQEVDLSAAPTPQEEAGEADGEEASDEESATAESAAATVDGDDGDLDEDGEEDLEADMAALDETPADAPAEEDDGEDEPQRSIG